MADFWIKLEKNTPDKPEIFEMAEILAIDPDAVLGKLIRVWCWVDSNSSDGHIKSVTPVLIDRLTMSQGFADAMTSVGWLEENSIPNFTRHLGESAKKRAKDSERKRMSRTTSDECPKKSVTESGLDKSRVDKSRVDKIIEDKQQKKKVAVKNDLFDVFWKAYPKKQCKAQALKYWNKINPNQQLFDLIISAVVKFKSSNEWKKDGGQFIPNASTWLNGERWEDSMTYGGIPNGQDQSRRNTKQTPIKQAQTDREKLRAAIAAHREGEPFMGLDDQTVRTQVDNTGWIYDGQRLSENFLAWCEDLQHFGDKEWDRAFKRIQGDLKDNAKMWEESWPPSSIAVVAYAEPPMCAKMYKSFDRSTAIEDLTKKEERLELGKAECSKLLSMFD